MAVAIAGSLSAQDILTPIPAEPRVPPVLRDQTQPPPQSRPPAPPQTPYKIGPLVLHPSLTYGYMNAEGLPTLGGRRVASEIYTVAAGLSVDLGEYWSLDYSPTWLNYTARAIRDSFDQSANISGAIPIRDWEFQFSQGYSQSSPTLVETGQQTKQETWATSLSSSYSFNPRVQVQASAGVNERYTDISPNTRAWTSNATVNLVLSPRLSLNLSPSFTYTEIVDAPDIYSESYIVGLNWRPVDKLSFALTTGRQYNHSTASAGVDLSNPLLNFSLGYQPLETTSLALSVAQTVNPSYFGDQVSKTFRWSVSLNQRLLGRFYLNVSYAPLERDDLAIDALTTAGRQDSVETYNVGLTTQLFGRLSVSATFTQTDNRSSEAGFSFSTKQYGVQLGYRY